MLERPRSLVTIADDKVLVLDAVIDLVVALSACRLLAGVLPDVQVVDLSSTTIDDNIVFVLAGLRVRRAHDHAHLQIVYLCVHLTAKVRLEGSTTPTSRPLQQ